mgnify:CR=1 FL=1
MRYAYRIMMTEMCELPTILRVRPGCTEGFSKEPKLIDETLYDTLEDAAVSLAKFESVATGIVMDKHGYKIRGVREFYIEKILVIFKKKKLLSFGAVKYASFETFKDYIPSICPLPPCPVEKIKNRSKRQKIMA